MNALAKAEARVAMLMAKSEFAKAAPRNEHGRFKGNEGSLEQPDLRKVIPSIATGGVGRIDQQGQELERAIQEIDNEYLNTMVTIWDVASIALNQAKRLRNMTVERLTAEYAKEGVKDESC